MLRITFNYKDKIVTWFLNPLGIFLVSYTIGSLTCIVIITILQILKNRKSKKSLEKIRGGDGNTQKLVSCIQKEGSYEIVSSSLKSAIRKILKLRRSNKLIVVDRIIALLASTFLIPLNQQIMIHGVDIVIENVSGVLVPLGLGGSIALIAASVALKIPLPWIVGLWLSSAASFGGYVRHQNYESQISCDEIVRYLPDLADRSMTPVQYLEEYSRKDKIILKTQEKSELFLTQKDTIIEETCELEFLDPTIQTPIVKKGTKAKPNIKRSCSKKSEAVYIPLKERTKTLSDIKKGDTTENLEKVRKFVVSEEEKKILDERLKN